MTKSPPAPHPLARLRYRATATVGERGQVALPAELRHGLDIGAGEKLLVFEDAECGGILLLDAKAFAKIVQGAPADLLVAALGGKPARNGKEGER